MVLHFIVQFKGQIPNEICDSCNITDEITIEPTTKT
jgi:hypothetical protein